VAPGLHRPQLGEHSVVWWDPRALELDRDWSVGLRQQRILEADQGEAASQRGMDEHREWQEQRALRLERGALPSLVSLTATARAAAAASAGEIAADLPPVAIETVPGARGERPAGRRFGSLVHAVLASVDLAEEPGSPAVERCAHAQGRLLGASEAEVTAAAAAAHAALAHPLLRRAAASESLRRETAVLWVQPDGAVIEGVVDLAFREPGEGGAHWTVVDFKTDRELGPQRAVYEAQVQIYARAIAAATSEPAAAVLLIV
jgi:ATP-dependent exoDNAse (exonuclease V) beta subunit